MPHTLAGLLFASALTSMQGLMLLWLNAAEPPPPTERRRAAIPIAPRTSQPPPPPRRQLPNPDASLSALAPARAELAPPTKLSPLAAPSLPRLALALPGLGVGQLSQHPDGDDAGRAATRHQPGSSRAAAPVNRPAPRYPRRARERGLEGEVVVRLRVEADGRVSDAVVVHAEPTGVFEDAAIAAALQYRFRPAVEDGAPVATTLEQRVLFRLSR